MHAWQVLLAAVILVVIAQLLDRCWPDLEEVSEFSRPFSFSPRRMFFRVGTCPRCERGRLVTGQLTHDRNAPAGLTGFFFRAESGCACPTCSRVFHLNPK